ncbi:MAG: outer membrane lipoprotein-sorting protein [Pyrinomonadaceae bacterium]|nr:outer membrane lipoprotein-sorting protein [Pyrinomonadaceae bacterium]
MLPLKFTKILLSVALCGSACRFWQPKPEAAPSPSPVSVEAAKSDAPFGTKEPEIFQTEIVVTSNGVETVIFAARNGANRLTVYDYRKKSEFALLLNGEGSSFIIARRLKIYTENQAVRGGETPDDFSTAELLNFPPIAVYELLGAENGLTKYRVVSEASNASEIIVTVDEKINLPVKQEFYSVSDGRKTSVSTTELKNFALQTDAQNFELPKDYKKVSAAEFQDVRRRER